MLSNDVSNIGAVNKGSQQGLLLQLLLILLSLVSGREGEQVVVGGVAFSLLLSCLLFVRSVSHVQLAS